MCKLLGLEELLEFQFDDCSARLSFLYHNALFSNKFGNQFHLYTTCHVERKLSPSESEHVTRLLWICKICKVVKFARKVRFLTHLAKRVKFNLLFNPRFVLT